jgi:DDE superfamily endonuclease
MSYNSFQKILEVIKPQLEVNTEMAKLRGGAILPELCLYIPLCYLAGGCIVIYNSCVAYQLLPFIGLCGRQLKLLIKCSSGFFINSSFSYFIKRFRTESLDEVRETAIGFQTISLQGCIWNCVSVIDGYHLPIQTPSKKEAMNVKSFFSGHYQTYGINVQAACDHNSWFTFFSVLLGQESWATERL